MPYNNAHFYRCYDRGTGSFSYPTLLLHGLGGNHLSWPATIRRIAGQKIFALDLPGHGASKLPACPSIDCHIRYLHQFITGMNFYRINLVGHSMGAAIAYAYACKYPDHIRKLTLISYSGRFHYLQELEQLLTSYTNTEKAVDLIASKGFHIGFSKQIKKEVLSPLRAMRHSVMFADVRSCLDANSMILSNHHKFPIQLISGIDDQFVPGFEVSAFSHALKSKRLHLIKDCGHMVVFEKPEVVPELLKDFLEEPLGIWS